MNRSIQIDDSADAYLLRGLFYSETGKPVEALSDLEKALELGLDAGGTQIAEELLEELRVKAINRRGTLGGICN